MYCVNCAVSVPVFGRAAPDALCEPRGFGACFWACGPRCIVQTARAVSVRMPVFGRAAHWRPRGRDIADMDGVLMAGPLAQPRVN